MSAAADPGRNSDGTFKSSSTAATGTAPGSEQAPGSEPEMDTHPSAGLPASVDPSRNSDGTFMKGSSATNPDNFANKSTKEVKALATEGGKHSHDNDGKK